MQFVVFAGLVAGILYLHFFLAHREWRKLKGEQTSDINSNYVRTEGYASQSFRQKLQECMQLPESTPAANGVRFIQKGRERIRVSGPVEYGPNTSVDDILVVHGDFSCGGNCVFPSEIYVQGKCYIGGGSRLQAIAVDGHLALGSSVTVMRWVDSAGQVDIGEGARIYGRVTSRTSVHIAHRAEVSSVYAPEIFASNRHNEVEATAGSALEPLEIPLPSGPEAPARGGSNGFDLHKLARLSSDSWIYNGDLVLSAPLRLKTKLVVKGKFACPAGSVLDGDIKADGSMQIGAGSVSLGNLIASGSIHMGPASRFQGVIHAGETLRLCRGVRGIREGGLVAAYSVGPLYVENNVVVQGKLASAEHVVAIPPGSDL